MKKYEKDKLTYGVELEFADVYRFSKLPFGNQWNQKDYTILNSSGIANDPLGKLWEYGGEINTSPTSSVEKTIENIFQTIKLLEPKPTNNYRCNLHVHIGVPGLREKLSLLKKFFIYVNTYQKEVFKTIDPIPKPIDSDFKNKEAFDGAVQRYRRRLVSHHYCVIEKNAKRIMGSKTAIDFLNNHAVTNKKQELLWHITPRAGINMRQLWETDTIEFRHFPGTIDIDEFYSCILWCREFSYAALVGDVSPDKIFFSRKWKFPKFRKYIHEMDLLWRLTNLGKNSRGEVLKNIEKIVNNGELLDVDKYRKISNQLESGYPKFGGIKKWI